MAADKAAPLALIVNELVTNALKHCLRPIAQVAKLGIRVYKPNGKLRIEVSDDGKGMERSPDFLLLRIAPRFLARPAAPG